jgi:LPS export ABC transporter protein LptC
MHSEKRTWLVIAGAVLLMAAVIGWLLSSKPTAGTVKEVKETNPHQVTGSTIEETKNGRKVWSLTVDSMLYDRKAQINHMKGIKGTFYDEDGTSMTVTADEGDVNAQTRDVILTKNPKGTTSTNGTVTADKITWKNKEQTVVAEGNARITKDDVVALAEKATFNVPMEHAALEGNASVQKGEFKQ